MACPSTNRPNMAASMAGAESFIVSATGETLMQIRAAVQKCRWSVRYIKLGYAAFMAEEAFRAIADRGTGRNTGRYERFTSSAFR